MRRVLVLAAASIALGLLPAPAGAVPCEPERCRAFATDGWTASIVAGPDGALWFAGDGFVGRMTSTGAVTRYPAPVRVTSDIARGIDGALWATVGDGRVARVTPDGQVSLRDTGVSSGPAALAGAPDGAMWFAAGRTVGWVTVGGRSERYPLPLPPPYHRHPDGYMPPPPGGVIGTGGLALGPDGAVWLADEAGYLYRVAPGGAPTIQARTYGGIAEIVAGPDGGVWFTIPGTVWAHHRAIGRVSPSTGRVVYYGTSRRPVRIVAGPSHSIWFTMGNPPTIVRMTPSGFQTFFQVDGTFPLGLAVGANGDIFMSRTPSGIVRLSPFLGARVIRTRVLRVNTFAGATSVRLFCPKYDLIFCTGRLTLRHRGRVIGGAPFSHRVNDAPATRIVLNARGRRLTRRPRRIRASLVIDQHDQGGSRRRSVQNVYLEPRR